MKRFQSLFLITLLGLGACQSTPPTNTVAEEPAATPDPQVAPVPEVVPDTILATREGFSPLAMSPNNTMTLELKWAGESKPWTVRIVAADGTEVKTWTGSDPMPSLLWDGRDDTGNLVPQGMYHGVLREGGLVVDESASFLVDIDGPSGSLTVTNDTSRITLGLNIVDGGASWTSWRLRIMHPDGRMFRDFISEDHRDNLVVWDGRSLSNNTLEAGTTYRVEAEVSDMYGNSGVITAELAVAEQVAQVPAPAPTAAPKPMPTPVTVTLNGSLLAELQVYFPPFSSELGQVSDDLKAENTAALQQLADLLASVSNSHIVLVGHANHLFFDNPKAVMEQVETLLPLSQARADAVRDALTDLGIPAQTLETQGVGGEQPLVPFSDVENRWKNRRVNVEITS